MPTTNTPPETAKQAEERERLRRYYREHREEILRSRRSRYAHDATHRAAVNKANRERYAKYKRGFEAAQAVAQSFADFSTPVDPTTAERMMNPCP